MMLFIQVFQSSVNMYTWDASSRNVTTGLVALTITSDRKQRTNIAHFTDPLIISVPGKCYKLAILREIWQLDMTFLFV